MISTPPILSNFPSVEVHTSMNIHAIFRAKRIHSLSLEAGRMLKESIIIMFRDEFSTPKSTKFGNGNQKKFRSSDVLS